MTELIPIDMISPNPWQPRQTMDLGSLEELAISIARDGLLFPIIVRPAPCLESGSPYQVGMGHRRLAAFEILFDISHGAVDGHNPILIDWIHKALEAGKSFDKIPADVQDMSDRQMFEKAIQENLQRKDLNPIEQASAMQRYMQEFKVSSEEAGEFFGVSGSTVRGTVRLLDLPEKAKTALAEGRITTGTGRLLLSTSRVMNDKAFNSVMQDINKGDVFPDQVIQDHLFHEHGYIEEMWRERNGDHPRGGPNGWLLDMKNFPNNKLAPLTNEEKAGLNAEQIEHLVNPPACTACSSYIKINGTHFCGIRICFLRKRNAFKAQKLDDLSRTLKIDIYQKTDGSYIPLDDDYASHKKAFEKRNPDLRLIDESQYKGGWVYQTFEGLNNQIARIVVIGQSKEKLSVSGSHTRGGKLTEVEKAERRAMKAFRKHRKDLLWHYTEIAQHIFNGVPSEAMEHIRRWHYVQIDDKIPDEFRELDRKEPEPSAEFKRRDLVWAMLDQVTSFYCRSNLAEALEKYKKITSIPAPQELIGIAKKWDDEINGLATVSVETEGE